MMMTPAGKSISRWNRKYSCQINVAAEGRPPFNVRHSKLTWGAVLVYFYIARMNTGEIQGYSSCTFTGQCPHWIDLLTSVCRLGTGFARWAKFNGGIHNDSDRRLIPARIRMKMYTWHHVRVRLWLTTGGKSPNSWDRTLGVRWREHKSIHGMGSVGGALSVFYRSE